MKQAAAAIDHMNVRMLNVGCMAEVNLSLSGEYGDAHLTTMRLGAMPVRWAGHRSRGNELGPKANVAVLSVDVICGHRTTLS
jgi:hypothetical protein